jgi:hypothetical protein
MAQRVEDEPLPARQADRSTAASVEQGADGRTGRSMQTFHGERWMDGMDRVRIEEAAAYLADARKGLNRVERLPKACCPSSIGEAHAVQDAVMAALGETVGA